MILRSYCFSTFVRRAMPLLLLAGLTYLAPPARAAETSFELLGEQYCASSPWAHAAILPGMSLDRGPGRRA